MARIDMALFHTYKDKGLITCRKHPTVDLFIWNYTAQAQWEHVWDGVTTIARGLITDKHGTIKARPFPKFHNIEEHTGDTLPRIPNGPFTVTEKVDGSLGILYFVDHVPYVATRGSFESEQARHATALLHERYLNNVAWSHLERLGITLLWEIVYPENRIVVDYGSMDELILLAAINADTGAEYDIVSFKNHSYEGDPVAVFPVVQHYDGLTDVHTIRDQFSATSGIDSEGFVVRFQSGLRVKLKFSDYVRLHRLMTGFTARNIWDVVRNAQGRSVDDMLSELLRDVPEEFEQWARNTACLLIGQYDVIEESARGVYDTIKGLPTRKEQAQMIAQYSQKAVVFKMLDNQPYEELIWKGLRPSAEKPFKQESEATS